MTTYTFYISTSEDYKEVTMNLQQILDAAYDYTERTGKEVEIDTDDENCSIVCKKNAQGEIITTWSSYIQNLMDKEVA